LFVNNAETIAAYLMITGTKVWLSVE